MASARQAEYDATDHSQQPHEQLVEQETPTAHAREAVVGWHPTRFRPPALRQNDDTR